jgi:hypothetical protein
MKKTRTYSPNDASGVVWASFGPIFFSRSRSGGHGGQWHHISSPHLWCVVSGVVGGPCDGGSGRVLTMVVVVEMLVALAIVRTHML